MSKTSKRRKQHRYVKVEASTCKIISDALDAADELAGVYAEDNERGTWGYQIYRDIQKGRQAMRRHMEKM